MTNLVFRFSKVSSHNINTFKNNVKILKREIYIYIYIFLFLEKALLLKKEDWLTGKNNIFIFFNILMSLLSASVFLP